MKCKCCGELCEFTLLQETLWKKRYKCSNCNKNFWADQDWLQKAKKIKSLRTIFTVAVVLGNLAEGDVVGALEIALKINLDDEA